MQRMQACCQLRGIQVRSPRLNRGRRRFQCHAILKGLSDLLLRCWIGRSTLGRLDSNMNSMLFETLINSCVVLIVDQVVNAP